MENNSNQEQSDLPFKSRLHSEASEKLNTRDREGKQNPEAPPLGRETPDPNDVRVMLKKIDDMHNDLERQLKYIDENIKYLPKEIQKYYTDPTSVVKDHNRQIEEYEKTLEEKLVKLVGQSVATGIETRKQKLQQKKGNKAQRIRGRNKWISMD